LNRHQAATILVDLQGVTKDYRRFRALEQVTLRIGRGVTGLLGPNGAGKTTLIKVMLGLVRCTAGSGRVLGHDIRRERRAVRSRVGYMPEDDSYIYGLSGVEMVRFSARLSGLPSVEALRRAHEICDFCGIAQERYRNVETYSTGMRQTLKFAQSIVHDPDFLILDEPTAGLDPEERQALLKRVRRLAEHAGKSVLISTHILPDVQQVCDQVVILVRGRVRIVERLEVLSRPDNPSLLVRVSGDSEVFLSRLRAAGAEAIREENGVLSVRESAEMPQRLWELAREAGVSIRSLTPSRNSLETIFLDAVRGEPSSGGNDADP
jgi:ABC-2 type transport system ATP-binding protein